MKKLMILSLVAITSIAFNASVFAQSSSAKAVAKAENPWSVTGIMELARSVKDRPESAFKNATTLLIGRKILEDVTLKLYLPVENSFKANSARQNTFDEFFSFADPVIAAKKGDLFKVAGFSASGDVRVYLPLTTDSRAEGIDRNTNKGTYRYTVAANREVGPWTFELYQQARYYTFSASHNPASEEKSVNSRYRLINEASVAFKANDIVTGSLTVDFYNHFTRSSIQGEASQLLELTASADVTSGIENLSSVLHFTAAAPNQNPSKFFESSDSMLSNLSMLLEVSYTFL